MSNTDLQPGAAVTFTGYRVIKATHGILNGITLEWDGQSIAWIRPENGNVVGVNVKYVRPA